MEEVRLQKYIASCGICSRRNAEKLILDGLIKVNGEVVTELGTKIIPSKDRIEYNGKEIIENNELIYILLNFNLFLQICKDIQYLFCCYLILQNI